MKKKFIIFASTGLLIASMLTACGSKEEVKEEKTTNVAEKETSTKKEKVTTEKENSTSEETTISEGTTTEQGTTTKTESTDKNNETSAQSQTSNNNDKVVQTTPTQTEQKTTSKKQETATTTKKQSTTSKKEETTTKKTVVEEEEDEFVDIVYPVSNDRVWEDGEDIQTVFGKTQYYMYEYSVVTYSDGSKTKDLLNTATAWKGTYKIPTDQELYNYAKGVVDKNWSEYEKALITLNNHRKTFNDSIISGKSPNTRVMTDSEWQSILALGRTEPIAMLTLDRELCIYATMRAVESYLSGITDHTRPDGRGASENDLGIFVSSENLTIGGSLTDSNTFTLGSHYNNLVSATTKVGFGIYGNIAIQKFN